MSGDSNGVVVYRATRLSMIEAVRSAHPAPAGRLRRNKRLSHAELADAILATLPEAEPDPLKAVEAAERIIAARDAEIELMRRDFRSAEKLIGERDAEITRKNGRCDDLFATGRRKDEQIEELGQEARTSEALIETLRARVEELEPFEPRTGGLSIAPDGSPVIDVHFPEEFARLMLGNFRWYLDKHEAPNYVHMPMTDMGSGEQYWVTIGRPGGKSPHELRVAAEGDAARLRDRIAAAVTALRPLAKLKGPTVADRARVTSQVIIGLEAGDPQESAP